MRPDDSLGRLFEDLEQQAEGLLLSERDIEVQARSRAEYATVTFLGRLHASVGRTVCLTALGVGPVEGRLGRVGSDWCLLEVGAADGGGAGQEWVVALAAVQQAVGLSEQAVSEPARPVVAGLSLRSALRGIAEAVAPVSVVHLDGTRQTGRLGRVGADFVEFVPTIDGGRVSPRDPVRVLPLGTLAAVRRT